MPPSREEEYLKALEIAKTNLLHFPDFQERCRIAGAEWQPFDHRSLLYLPFFNDTCQISVPDFEFTLRERKDRISLSNQILILHYLIGVKDSTLANKTISFKDVPAGEFYYPAFVQRSIGPLLQTFGNDPQAFTFAAEQLGGQPVKEGDVGMKFHVFPKAPVALILWLGDDEFPPDLNILFDATIRDFLSTEDIAVLAQEVMIRMIKSHHTHYKNSGHSIKK